MGVRVQLVSQVVLETRVLGTRVPGLEIVLANTKSLDEVVTAQGPGTQGVMRRGVSVSTSTSCVFFYKTKFTTIQAFTKQNLQRFRRCACSESFWVPYQSSQV